MALVLIPGFMLNRDLWADMEPDLAPHGPLIHADPSVGDSIEAMASLTLEAAPERFALVGFSMGGYVARDMVRRAPERVTDWISGRVMPDRLKRFLVVLTEGASGLRSARTFLTAAVCSFSASRWARTAGSSRSRSQYQSSVRSSSWHRRT